MLRAGPQKTGHEISMSLEGDRDGSEARTDRTESPPYPQFFRLCKCAQHVPSTPEGILGGRASVTHIQSLLDMLGIEVTLEFEMREGYS